MKFAFEPPPTPSVTIENSTERFPVSRIFCIGKNYAAHAREMGVDPESEPPSIFTKPANSVFDADESKRAELGYPALTTNLHHEIELVVAIGRGGFEIAREDALDHVFGYAVGLDLTRRDMQTKAKEKRQPWAMSKGFDGAAPIASIRTDVELDAIEQARIWSAVDGDVRQDGQINEMIWPVPDIIRVLSRHLELLPGDLVFTGTPAGVGPIERGEVVTGGIDGLPGLWARVV